MSDQLETILSKLTDAYIDETNPSLTLEEINLLGELVVNKLIELNCKDMPFYMQMWTYFTPLEVKRFKKISEEQQWKTK